MKKSLQKFISILAIFILINTLSPQNIQAYDENTTVTNEKLQSTVILENNSGLNLVVRQYIYKINGEELANSREPVVQEISGALEYRHTKYPLEVQPQDLVTYKIRIYNESAETGYAKEIVQYLPDGLEFVQNNINNIKYKWVLSDDGKKITTTYLENTEISAYNNDNNPSYAELEFTCKVIAEKQLEEDTRLVVATELTKAISGSQEQTEGNLSIENLAEYKEQEAYNSNSTSYVKGTEKDDDFENVIIKRQLPVDYTIRIEKIDGDTKELLNGAKFELLNENKEPIKTGITTNGGVLDFGMITTHGTQDDVYYIRETETPEGYKKVIQDEVKLVVHKTVTDPTTEEYTIEIECDVLQTRVLVETQESVIPIYTEEQLSKIGSNETVTIDGKSYNFGQYEDYVLKNDIVLQSENWTPISNFSGIFDGAGYTISNLKYTQDGDGTTNKIGLFAEVSGTIKDLNLTNIQINITNITTEIDAKIEEAQERLSSATTTADRTAISEEIAELQKQREELVDKYNVGGLVGCMQEGTLQNCTVSGTINSDTNNGGGLVGLGANGKLLIINGCTNNVNVTITGSKAGGLIGTGYGALSIVDSTNNGTITAEKYNAGGLVGYEEAKDYKVSNVVVKLDKTKNTITLTVENKRHIGEYTLSLKNVDIDTYDLIEGAKFNVLDENKQIISGYENIELKNGMLQIATYDIEELGTDTYYVVQTQTPDGYVDVTEYVKVVISKQWNGTAEKYEVAVNIDVINEDEFEDDENTDDSYSDSRTNQQYVIKEAEDVTWKVNKVYVKNSTNNGTVKAGLYNAAGIIGKTKCIAELENCTNKGTISSNLHSAGMIAEALKLDDDTVVRLNGCINDGIITVNEEATSIDDIAGFISYTEAPVEINNCTNNSNITSTIKDSQGQDIEKNVSAIAGFVATSKADVTIKNSTNNGDMISNSAREISGFIAKQIESTTKITIENSTNTGNILGGARTSGFVAFANCNKIIINNCKVIGTEEEPIILEVKGYSPEVAGLVAIAGADVEISNCQVDNVQLKTEGGFASILVGQIDGMLNTATREKIAIVKDCTANNILLQKSSAKQETDQILVEFGGAIAKTVNSGVNVLKVENCSISNLNISENVGISNAGGMVGMAKDITKVDLINNTVSQSNLSSNVSNQAAIGGMLGTAIVSSSANAIVNIENCKFEKGTISALYGNYLSGMVGMFGSASNSNLNISGCTVEETQITAKNSGNMVAGIFSGGTSTPKTEIVKCLVNNSNITNNDTSNSNMNTGGIAGFISSSINFVDCDVKNSTVSTKNGKVGGILAMNAAYSSSGSTSSMNLEDCDVVNTSVKRTVESTGYVQSTPVGGLVAHISGLQTTIKNCNVISENETSEIMATGFTGGLIGYTAAKVNIENAEVKNMNLTANNTTSNYVAGMIAFANGQTNLKNVKVSDISLDGLYGMGGIYGYASGTSTLTNADVNNVEMKNHTTSSISIAGVAGMASQISIDNINVNNITAETETQGMVHVGGVLGYAGGTTSILNAQVKEINLNNNTTQGITGGLIALAPSTTTLEGINMDNIDATGNFHVGGIIGSGSTIKSNENNGEINISNVNVVSDNTTTTSNMVSAAIGNASGTLKNINVKNAKLNNTSATNSVVGGVLANGSATIDNCSVDTLEIISDTEGTYASSVGGIAGVVNSDTSNSTVDGIKINSNATNSNISAGIGNANGSVTNINISNANIISNNTEKSSSHVGGIVAGMNNGSKELTNSNIEEITIEATNVDHIGGITAVLQSSVRNSNVKSATISNNTLGASLGGIVGVIGSASAEIENSTVNNSSITNGGNTYTLETDTNVKLYEGGTGGILGVGSGLIVDCEVNNTRIVSNEDTSYATGGIVGHGSNVKNRITAIQDSKVYNTYIEGKDAVGGIAGSAVPSVSGCSVEGDEKPVVQTTNEEVSTMSLEEEVVEAESYTTMIVGENYVGGIIGFAGQLTTTPNTVRLETTLVDCIIKDIKVSGKTFVDEAIGKKSYYTDGETTAYDVIQNFVNTRGFVEVVE